MYGAPPQKIRHTSINNSFNQNRVPIYPSMQPIWGVIRDIEIVLKRACILNKLYRLLNGER